MNWIWLSAAAMVVTAAIHSWAGERMIVQPVLASDPSPLPSAQSQLVMRAGWHITSGFMILSAIVIAWPDLPEGPVIAITTFWLVLGLFSLVASRGRHVGWPTLLASGIFGILGATS